MSVAEVIFTQLMVAQQIFGKKCYAESH